MSIKLTFPADQSPNDISAIASKKPEVQHLQKGIRDTQGTIGRQIKKVFEKVFAEEVAPSSLFDTLRNPENILPKKEAPETDLTWADKENKALEIEPQEFELLKMIQIIHDTISQIETHRKTHEEKRRAADSARIRLTRITSALKTKGLEVKVDELTEETFQEELEKQAPEKEKDTWEAPLKGIWNQHKEYVPDYRERIEEALKLPSKEELENILEVDKETQGQLKKLLKRLSEKPEIYAETIGDVQFLLKKYLENLSAKLARLEIPLPATPSEWYLLQSLFNERISYTIEIKEQQEVRQPTEKISYRNKYLIGAALLLANVLLFNEIRQETKNNLPAAPTVKTPEPTPAPVKNPTPTTTSDLIYPQLGTALSANTDLTFRSSDPQFQPLIDELNALRQNGLRKVRELQPLADNGNIILFYPEAENTVEDFLKSFPQLIRVTPKNLRILSVVCTDETKRQDGQEMLSEICFEIIPSEKRYIVVEDLSVQNEIPEDRIIAPYKVFELKDNGQLDIALIVQRNEYKNRHLLEIFGKVGDKTINANATLRADLVDETSEIVGIVSGILMMNR